MEISIINDKSGCRAMFYYKGHIYTVYADTPREAKKKAELEMLALKGEALL